MSKHGSQARRTTQPRTRDRHACATGILAQQILLALCHDRDLCVVTLFPCMLGGLGQDRGPLYRDKDFLALCRDRNSVSQQGLGQGQVWVETRVFLCRDRVFSGVGHSCSDRMLFCCDPQGKLAHATRR